MESRKDGAVVLGRNWGHWSECINFNMYRNKHRYVYLQECVCPSNFGLLKGPRSNHMPEAMSTLNSQILIYKNGPPWRKGQI